MIKCTDKNFLSRSRTQPAQSPQRAVHAPLPRAQRGAQEVRRGPLDRRNRADRLRARLRGRRRHKGDEGPDVFRRVRRRLHRAVVRHGVADQEARHQRGQWPRPRRRLRARHDGRHHVLLRRRQLRPARDQAGHHSRRGRLAEADARHWQKPRYGAHPHRQLLLRQAGRRVGARREGVRHAAGVLGRRDRNRRKDCQLQPHRRQGLQGGCEQESGSWSQGRRRVRAKGLPRVVWQPGPEDWHGRLCGEEEARVEPRVERFCFTRSKGENTNERRRGNANLVDSWPKKEM
ncbi:uncharacterized protein PV09_01060 [Verruconis gallopava]|uniref:Uncharacterized protein n=1 Tax=Verruconis gallopava TaxID=253628 RepID=A0A0D1XZ95_9PEZI|nr:uncharacterized protein PV09_01060 [Verruconis gallopava]KIW08126.1 hypothetical protein PV09_01060 [Verruconis gallopava]